MLIYKAQNKINGKSYVGQTIKDLECRKRQHINDALNDNRGNSYFHRAIKKYSPDNFEWVIIHNDITDIEDLNRLEIFYINYYDTFGNGYNLTEGGGGSVGYSHTEESLRKISTAQKGRMPGKKHPNYDKFGKDSFSAKAVFIENKQFNTLNEAAQFIGITPSAIRYRILHNTKWQEYSYV